jgi:hypothetical protein
MPGNRRTWGFTARTPVSFVSAGSLRLGISSVTALKKQRSDPLAPTDGNLLILGPYYLPGGGTAGFCWAVMGRMPVSINQAVRTGCERS